MTQKSEHVFAVINSLQLICVCFFGRVLFLVLRLLGPVVLKEK